MNPRFPPIEAIQKTLIYTSGPLMPACLSGALTSYYETATAEFERLRELAQAAVDGDPDDRERLAKFLKITDETAEMYAAAVDGIAVAG